jgi:hypothetical protein
VKRNSLSGKKDEQVAGEEGKKERTITDVGKRLLIETALESNFPGAPLL